MKEKESLFIVPAFGFNSPPPEVPVKGVRYQEHHHCKEVVELGKQGKTFVQIASSFGISKRSFYNWINLHPEFAEATELSRTHAQSHWEEVSRKGAEGENERINSNLTMFRMRNQFKEDYTETKHIQTTNMTLTLSDADLLKRIEAKLKGSPELLEGLKGHPMLTQLEAIEGELVEKEADE